MLNVGGEQVGLVGVEQAFLDVRSLDLVDKKAAEKLLEIVQRKNYIPESAEGEYKIALLAEYKNFIAKGLKMSKEKDEKKGLFGFLKRPKSGCCDMKIVEVKEETGKKGCCDFKILPEENERSK
jgi:hypothetical protein